MESVFAPFVLVWLAAAAGPVDFAREIRPLLSDRCFTCHGPDEKTRMAGLRLDLEADAKRPRGARTPVLAGQAAASEIVKRITSAKMRMPPPGAAQKPFTEGEVALLKRWIDEGAKWQSHWAYTAPVPPPPPAVKRPRWIRNEIDHFVLARLEKEGLAPAPETDRARLLRRVSFDLTGLPPTLAELDSLLKDPSPRAYEKAVDRLLASPRYGERMATIWLDAARYADTHGYQVDPEKEMWAWRDWVVSAFNRNLPFDQFTIEQLAGDLLPNPTLDQQIATGFHRNLRVNTEAGSIAEEFHNENVVDRVATTGSVWLGLTVGCARCHDHKYDPISARDFYSLYAFFNSVPEIGTGGPRDGRGNLGPVLKLPAPELEARLARKELELGNARADLVRVEARVAAAGQAAWEKSPPEPHWQTLRVLEAKATDAGVILQPQPDGSLLSTGAHPAKTRYEITVETPLENITGLRLELLPDARLPGRGSGRGEHGKGVLTLFELRAGGRKLPLARITTDFASAESLADQVLRPMAQLARGWDVSPQTAERHFAVIEPAQLLSAAKLTITLGSEYGAGTLLGRFRLAATRSEFPEVLPANIQKILRSPTRSKEDAATLRAFYVRHPADARLAQQRVNQLDAERRTIENQIPSTMVMREMDAPRETHVLTRGAYDQPGAPVTPRVPAFLPPLPAGAKADRLTLARWLVDPAHPLTARVAVNRLWLALFGQGLVRTAEDFGSQGEPPTHSDLLDWLATQFVQSGWNVKAMQKRMVMSATYRQSSKWTAQLKERDPENRLLARGPRFRLPAEMIRDQALAASGLLVEKLGGPPVKPYQPDGLWEQLSVIDDRKLYEPSTGPDLWRRSLYTYWKRTVPPPSMTTFDAPTREFCVIQRPLSSTPLQALALLNDETYVEAARKLAERMLREGGPGPASRLAYGFRLVTSRNITPPELAALSAGLARRRASLTTDVLKLGEAPVDAKLKAQELAAYTSVASVLLNLDEAVTKE